MLTIDSPDQLDHHLQKLDVKVKRGLSEKSGEEYET